MSKFRCFDNSPNGIEIDTFAVTTLPTKTSYDVGDTLDTTGIVVTATADGMTGNVASYCTFSPTTLSDIGTTAITVEYYDKTTTFNVTVEETIGTLEETDWATIQRKGSTGTGAQYWAVGDTKTVVLNGAVGDDFSFSNTSLKVFIIGFNHQNVNGIYFQGFTNGSKMLSIFSNQGYQSVRGTGRKSFNWSHWGTTSYSGTYAYGGWKGCDLRYDILGSTDTAPSGYGGVASSGRVGYDASSTTATSPVSKTLMSTLPSALRAVMAPMTIYTDNVGGNCDAGDVTASVDYLPFLSQYELTGNSTGINAAEASHQAQFTYYANGGSKSAYGHSLQNNALIYGLRSYYNDGTHSKFAGWNSAYSSGYNSYEAGYMTTLLPFFRVA